MIWFISDTHFFHDNILKFIDSDGKPVRYQHFQTSQEMNETMVKNWNRVVSPSDKVYHLGDVAVGVKNQSAFTELMYSLNGKKRLILGNHDNIQQPAYKAFERIELWTGGKFSQYGFVCSHIPLREDSMRDAEINVHGHIHQNESPSDRHICVCVEHIDYTPVSLDQIVERIHGQT